MSLHAALDKPQSNMAAMIADYGPSTQITRSGDGLSTPTSAPSDCWGPSSARRGPDGQIMDYSSCYQQPIKPTVEIGATQGWRLSRGILDSSNRESLYHDVETVPGTEYEFDFPIMPVESTIPAGHRLGIVLMANSNALQRNGTTGTRFTMNAKLSTISLPVVGGLDALVAAGGLADTTAATATVGGTVPATLGLTLDGPVSFGAFTPGVEKDYTASAAASVVSTAGTAALAVSEPGHLANGAFKLAAPLSVAFSKASWDAPVSNDPVTISFAQHVGASEPLRTGTYSRTLTFTLSTTAP